MPGGAPPGNPILSHTPACDGETSQLRYDIHRPCAEWVTTGQILTEEGPVTARRQGPALV